MSTIFKERKPPRHLVIKEEYELKGKARSRLGAVLFWVALVVGISWLAVRSQAGI